MQLLLALRQEVHKRDRFLMIRLFVECCNMLNISFLWAQMLTPVRAFFALSSNKEAQLDEIPKLEQSTSRKATLNLEQRQ